MELIQLNTSVSSCLGDTYMKGFLRGIRLGVGSVNVLGFILNFKMYVSSILHVDQKLLCFEHLSYPCGCFINKTLSLKAG